MNSNSTNNFDIYSTFSYDDITKYFENLNKCNSDKDCPENSSCIGNKCITTFYCKEGDNSTCSLFQYFCDGKSCNKSSNECTNNEDCLSDRCSNNYCVNEYYTSESNSVNSKSIYHHLINQYSISHFTYEDAKKYYEKLNINNCTSDENCPNHSYCGNGIYSISTTIGCPTGNCTGHCISQFYCKRDRSDCSFIRDNTNELIYSSRISITDNMFGLEHRDKCRYDTECLENGCDNRNFFGIGNCDGYIDSVQAFGVNAVVFSLCIIPLIINEAIIIFFVWYRRLKNKKIERKEIFEEKYSTKGLTIIGILIVVLILLIFILIGIHDYLNKQPLP